MLTQLFERRLIVVLGKGGVGKSTTSAALAICAARQGIRTLLMETDSRAPVAGALGVERSFKSVPVRAGFSTMVLEGGHALDEYLALVLPARAVLKAVFASRLYQFFVQAAPGLRELMMLGKVCYELSPDRHPRWDLVVVDAPASGQALSLLKMPTAARATFGTSVVGQEAEKIERTLHDRKVCAIVEVTTPETLAVSELLETQKALAAMDFPPAAIFLNRAATTDFSAGDVIQFARRAEASHGLRHLEQLMEAARAELARAAQTPRAHAKLARLSRSSIMEIPDFPGRDTETLVTHLASFFASRLNSGGVRHDAAKG
ncbi:MAG TPA: ArsA family ATPase [Candidatus Binataceae bacterium]|nr:ArsA family ATPase [Candidatus Binataceae bacterium]